MSELATCPLCLGEGFLFEIGEGFASGADKVCPVCEGARFVDRAEMQEALFGGEESE